MSTPRLTCTECGYTAMGFEFRWFPLEEIVLCRDEAGCAERVADTTEKAS